MAESQPDPEAWEGRCVHSESTLHQLSPFLGKMKSMMAEELISFYSNAEDCVLDPFCGSGTVPLEASIHGRHTYGIDRNPYSILLSEGKIHPPESESEAIEIANRYLDQIKPREREDNNSPDWVKEFFHPKTLSGICQLSSLLREDEENFLHACLLGILHHQRPGFLSYPASNLKPYLRDEKFPREEYPERYEYREIQPRLISKIERAYRRFPEFDDTLERIILQGNTPDVMEAELGTNSIDAIITSPPYMNKLDYGRDNRLRLYFLGIDDYSELDGSPQSKEEYRQFIDAFLQQATRVLKPHGRMVFVLGESQRSGAAVDTAEIIIGMMKDGKYGLTISSAIQDKVPVREINSMSSKTETILTLGFDRDQ